MITKSCARSPRKAHPLTFPTSHTRRRRLARYRTDKPDLREEAEWDDPDVLLCSGRGFSTFQVGCKKVASDPEHHPFTSPKAEDLPLLDVVPCCARQWLRSRVRRLGIGSGSLASTRRRTGARFQRVGLPGARPGQLLATSCEAFDYGAPPHGGIAIGVDRLVAFLAGQSPSAMSSPSLRTASRGHDDERARAGGTIATGDGAHLHCAPWR